MATSLNAKIVDPDGNVRIEADSNLLATGNKDLSTGVVRIRVVDMLEDSPLPPLMLTMLRNLTLVLELINNE